MRFRHWVMFVEVLVVIAMVVTIAIQVHNISRLQSKIENNQAFSLQGYLEEEYVPEQLEALTVDDLSRMGGVVWGE
ncbi:MAG: hypothetical protein JW885_11605 [Deltaproteobacteria bacterium]|nr:hypothetical protein [Candidatus Zymogenaceae bacterium]